MIGQVIVGQTIVLRQVSGIRWKFIMKVFKKKKKKKKENTLSTKKENSLKPRKKVRNKDLDQSIVLEGAHESFQVKTFIFNDFGRNGY